MKSFPWQNEALCINLHAGSARASLHGCEGDLGIALVLIHSSSREVLMGTDP